MYQTSHYSSYNLGDRGRFLTSPVFFRRVEEKVHENRRVISFMMMIMGG